MTAVAIKVLPVCFESIVQRVVDVMDGRCECAPPGGTTERTSDVRGRGGSHLTSGAHARVLKMPQKQPFGMGVAVDNSLYNLLTWL